MLIQVPDLNVPWLSEKSSETQPEASRCPGKAYLKALRSQLPYAVPCCGQEKEI